jgi:hypothetical protein
MNVEIGAEVALFPEKEYIRRIFVAVCPPVPHFPQRAGLPLHILAELGSQMLCCAFPSARPASIKGTVA